MHNVLDPHGPAAASLATYGWTVLIACLVVTTVMWGLLLWVAYRRRGSFDAHAPVESDGGIRWILIGGVAIPAVVLTMFFLGMLSELQALPLSSHGGDTETGAAEHPADADIVVTGHRWWWEIEYRIGGLPNYVTTATELHIPIGQPVDIALRTADVIHSFWVPSLHGKVDLLPRMTTRIRIQADDAGRYRGACAEFCGGQHTNMTFWVVAELPDVFDQWLANERRDARVPTSAAEQQGAAAFASRSCALCHRIRGTGARGTIGPDLTHFGSRDALAGPFPNQEAWRRAWIVHAQSLKPGVLMPSIIDVPGPELQAMSAYLANLH